MRYVKNPPKVSADHWVIVTEKTSNIRCQRVESCDKETLRSIDSGSIKFCGYCGQPLRAHGCVRLKEGEVCIQDGCMACPGDWLVQNERDSRVFEIMSDEKFKKLYSPVEEEQE